MAIAAVPEGGDGKVVAGGKAGRVHGREAPGSAGQAEHRQLLIQELLRDAYELDASGVTDLALRGARSALSARPGRPSTRGSSRPASAVTGRPHPHDNEDKGNKQPQHRPSSARAHAAEDTEPPGAVRLNGGAATLSGGHRVTYHPHHQDGDRGAGGGGSGPARRRPQSAAAGVGSRHATAARDWAEAAAAGVPWKHAIAKPLRPSTCFLTPPHTAPTPQHPRGQQQRPRTATARHSPSLRTRERVFSRSATARPASSQECGPPVQQPKAERCIQRSDVLSRDQHRLTFGVAPEQWRVPPTADGGAAEAPAEAATSLDLDSSILNVGMGPRSFDLMARTRDGLGGTRGSAGSWGLSGCTPASRPRTDLFLVREAVKYHKRLPCNSLVDINEKTGRVTVQKPPRAPMAWRPRPDASQSVEDLTRQHKLQIPERTKPRKHDRRVLHPGGFYEYLEGERQVIKTPPKEKPSRNEAIDLAVGDRVALPKSGETLGW